MSLAGVKGLIFSKSGIGISFLRVALAKLGASAKVTIFESIIIW
jgi:hypothetical protein